MKVFFNDEEKEIGEGETINTLLKKVAIKDRKGIAIAVNGEIYPKSKWDDFLLSNEDKITLIVAAAGC